MHRIGLFIVAGVMVAASAPVYAATECKSAVTSQIVPSEDQAATSWQTVVTSTYGSAWADFGRAQNKRYYDVNLVLAREFYVVAQPCRVTPIIVKPIKIGPLKKLGS